MSTRVGVIRNYALRHLHVNKMKYAIYGLSFVGVDNNDTSIYAEQAKDIKYFKTETDLNNYLAMIETKYKNMKDIRVHIAINRSEKLDS